MNFLQKSDVKNHLSTRHQDHIHLATASQPDAAGISGENQAAGGTSEAGLIQEPGQTPLVASSVAATVSAAHPPAPAELESPKV
jgi:hypothetical protein